MTTGIDMVAEIGAWNREEGEDDRFWDLVMITHRRRKKIAEEEEE